MSKCKLCKTETEWTFNIKFKRVTICDPCANAITYQQVKYLTENAPKECNTSNPCEGK